MACGVPKELLNGISNKPKGLLGSEKAAFRNVCEAYPGEEKTKIDIGASMSENRWQWSLLTYKILKLNVDNFEL